jgi:hypothetical protein
MGNSVSRFVETANSLSGLQEIPRFAENQTPPDADADTPRP